MPAGAATHQQTRQQHLPPGSHQIAVLPKQFPAELPAGDITFHAPAAARSSYTTKASPSSPDTFAPTTPDHMPDLPPCKVNPISDFQHMHHSQGAAPSRAAMSSFQQLLASQDLNQQDRLSKFQQLLASQDLDQDGEPLSGLAGRVQSMAAQLNALQKRTQASPSRIAATSPQAEEIAFCLQHSSSRMATTSVNSELGPSHSIIVSVF